MHALNIKQVVHKKKNRVPGFLLRHNHKKSQFLRPSDFHIF